MSLRAITGQPAAPSVSDLAERFWTLSPARPHRDEGAVEAVEALLCILERLRRSDLPSLAALLQEQAARGDHAYSSPEQLAAEPVTERSLVFSVGVLLFERLCHRHPFGADKQPLELVRVRRAELGSSVNYLPRLPPALRAILTRALSPLPEERFETLGDLAAALAMFSAHEPRQPRLPGAPPMPSTPRLATVSGALRARPISAWERLPTDDGADELAAPGLDEQLRAEPAAPRRFPRASDAPAPAPAPRRAVPAVAYLALGAVAAAAAFAVGRGMSQPAPEAAAAAAPAPVAVPAAAPPAAPEPEPAPAEPAAFAPEPLAELAAAAVGPCFAGDAPRPADFGLSLFFARHDPAVHKIYFGKASALTPAQKACISRAVTGIAAAAAPADPTTVELRMIPGRAGVRARVGRVRVAEPRLDGAQMR